jgi:WD40 repeat protein
VRPAGGESVRLFEVSLPETAQALAWSPDTERLVATTAAGTVHVIHLDGTHTEVSAKHTGGAFAVGWSARGDVVATGGGDGRVFFHDAEMRLEGVASVGHGWVEHLAWSGDGTCLAAAAGKHVRFFTRRAQAIGEPIPHASTVTSLTWHAATGKLVSTCYGGVQFLDVGKAAPVRELPWKGSILTGSISPDGRHLATGNQDASVHVWEIASGNDLQMSGYPMKVSAVAWGEGGPVLATGGGQVITVWSFAGKGPAGSTPVELSGHRGRITGLAFAAKGSLLVSVGDDGVFHVANRKPRWRSEFADAVGVPLSSLALSASGLHAAAAGRGGRVFVWRLDV